MSQLTVVMYHYVRDLERSRYPRIKGLGLEQFRGQLRYLAGRHTFVRVQDVIAACREGADLPANAVLLTFDDGYSDHYRYVLPILDELGVQGCFFPPTRVLEDRTVLDVNKIHFTLASGADPAELARHCLQRVADLQAEFQLEPPAAYVARHRHASRLDDADTMLVKRLLQVGLPEAARARITDEMFRRHVTADEAAFAEELYLTADQVWTMRRAGMEFGNHGVGHRWFDSLDAAAQREEMAGGVAMLRGFGYRDGEYVIAYPYGGHNAETVAIARDLGHALGFTTEVRPAALGQDDPLLLPRLDTVDLPHTPDGAA
ncbi:MAG: polysaccharide deacetylase family protein [Candidatus Krumholzibacteriia bacterium]